MTKQVVSTEEINAAANSGFESEGIKFEDCQYAYLDLDDVVYDNTENVRTGDLQSRILRKVDILKGDGLIRTPLLVCITPKMKKNAKPAGTCGFLRYGALKIIREKDPKFWAENFGPTEEFPKGRIPFQIVKCSDEARERIMLDHGMDESLTELEVFMMQQRLTRMMLDPKEINSRMSPLYYAMASAKVKTDYDKKLKELTDTGKVSLNRGNLIVSTVRDVRQHFWRGRYQYYEHILRAKAPRVREEFIKFLAGEEDAVIFKRKMAQQVEKLNVEQADKFFDKLHEQEQNHREKGGKAPTTGWGMAKIMSALQVNRSRYLGTQLTAVTGDTDAGMLLPQIEDELIRIEKAIDRDPDAFWAFVDKK